jgi:hypothetical protein
VQPKYPVDKKRDWAYHDQNQKLFEFTEELTSMPAGWNNVFGSTPTTGGTSYLYNRPENWLTWQGPWKYVDRTTMLAGSIPGPFTLTETNLLLAVHEISHQNGVKDDPQANGDAAQALENYRAAGGAACP